MTQIDSGNPKSRSYIQTITEEMLMNDEEARFDAHLNREIEANAPKEPETETFYKVYLTVDEAQEICLSLRKTAGPHSTLSQLIEESDTVELDEYGHEV